MVFLSSDSWKQIVSDKRAHREKTIQNVASQLPDSAQDSQILGATATEIVEGIKAGQWTAKNVVEAFISRAILAHKETNCLTEILFEQALTEADTLDQEYAKTRRLKGPLHGLPVTFKDQYDITGHDTTIGFTQWSNKPSQSDATLVALVRAAGGIVIAKTNVPQTMLAFECVNPLWGASINPWSKDHTCGGSSGGEAAVLSMDASTLGFGSDTGGSLRIPAHFCGIYSLKPGWGRISCEGARGPTPGFKTVPTVCGPMGRSVEDIKLAAQTLFGAGGSNNAEAYPPVPFREYKVESKLRFGYYLSDGVVKASPVCRRAVLETVDALKREGHECIEFNPPNVSYALSLFAALTSADGYETLVSQLGPDPRDKALFLVTLGPRLPAFIRWIAGKAVRAFKGDDIFAGALENSRIRNVHDHWANIVELDVYRKMWYREVWDKYGFDGIIAPVQASPAITHGATTTLSPLAIATFLYNVVDSPVGVVPVTRVDPVKDALTSEWWNGEGHGSVLIETDLYGSPNSKSPSTSTENGHDAKAESLVTQVKKTVYDPESMKGLPVGVQVVGKSWEDEKVIAMMGVVDAALGGSGRSRGFGPGAWKVGGKE